MRRAASGQATPPAPASRSSKRLVLDVAVERRRASRRPDRGARRPVAAVEQVGVAAVLGVDLDERGRPVGERRPVQLGPAADGPLERRARSRRGRIGAAPAATAGGLGRRFGAPTATSRAAPASAPGGDREQQLGEPGRPGDRASSAAGAAAARSAPAASPVPATACRRSSPTPRRRGRPVDGNRAEISQASSSSAPVPARGGRSQRRAGRTRRHPTAAAATSTMVRRHRRWATRQMAMTTGTSNAAIWAAARAARAPPAGSGRRPHRDPREYRRPCPRRAR